MSNATSNSDRKPLTPEQKAHALSVFEDVLDRGNSAIFVVNGVGHELVAGKQSGGPDITSYLVNCVDVEIFTRGPFRKVKTESLLQRLIAMAFPKGRDEVTSTDNP